MNDVAASPRGSANAAEVPSRRRRRPPWPFCCYLRPLMGLNHEHLSVYLNDHLAGANAAFAVLGALEDVPGFKLWVNHLRDEIASDRQVLESLMSDLKIEPGMLRQAMGRLTGKLGDIKTRVEDPSGGHLRELELLETLSLGIEGKKTLWVTLQSVAAHEAAIPKLDYERLITRAAEQRVEVEMRRLDVAWTALR